MREFTIILLAITIAAVIASKEGEVSKTPSSRSSSEEGNVVEGSGEDVLKKVEVGDQHMESSGAAGDVSLMKEEKSKSHESEGSGEISSE